ncbi:MAG: pitrilysin family protein [Bacteroidia bacterium]
MLDRSTPPAAQPLKNVSLPDFHRHTLSNGIPVYIMPFGTLEIVEIQVVFKAGQSYQPKTGIASFTARNMPEGTKSYSSLSLAQTLDAYGAWLNHESDDEGVSFSLATLSRHLGNTLPLLHEVITAPLFLAEEFDKMKERTLQQMQVNAQKTSNIARRYFDELLFGKDHPYGMYFGEEALKEITLPELIQYHHNYLYPGNFSIIASGRFDEKNVLNQLEENFGGLILRPALSEISRAARKAPDAPVGRQFFEKKGMQATLRMGYRTVPFSHPDYYPMQVVNTILGGYFGSRLMKNIREEKGYTYGIYSGWVGNKYDGYFVVQSDVGNQYITPTIQEVKAEMRKLSEEGVTEDELQLVSNYLLGKSIGQRETPFQMGDLVRYSIINDIPFKELDRKFEVIQNITTNEIQELANKYLKPDHMLEVVVGEMPAE